MIFLVDGTNKIVGSGNMFRKKKHSILHKLQHYTPESWESIKQYRAEWRELLDRLAEERRKCENLVGGYEKLKEDRELISGKTRAEWFDMGKELHMELIMAKPGTTEKTKEDFSTLRKAGESAMQYYRTATNKSE